MWSWNHVQLKDGGDSFERECVEEVCNFEEFDECFDLESGYVKVKKWILADIPILKWFLDVRGECNR